VIVNDQVIALRKPITGAIIDRDELSTRQSWWIKHPQAAITNKGIITPPIQNLSTDSVGMLCCVRGHGSGAKENAPAASSFVGAALRLPDPPSVIETKGKPMNTQPIRILKRYSAVSINNLINRFSVTAYTLEEARGLLPNIAVITSWTPVQEGAK
jgi:hypothetical protein